MTPLPDHVTHVLNAAASGDHGAADALLPLVYHELRVLARQRLAREPGGGAGLTLQPTALVHEAYLRLLDDKQVQWKGRGHFFAAAAHAMRRIMVERARRYRSVKHGAGGPGTPALRAGTPGSENRGTKRLPLDEHEIALDQAAAAAEQLLDLEQAMARLEARDSRKAGIVMLRFYAGLSIEQTALALELSPATVKNEWRFARAWLHSEVSRHDGD